MTGFTPTAVANTGCVLFMTAKCKCAAWLCDWLRGSINNEGWNQVKGHFEERWVRARTVTQPTVDLKLAVVETRAVLAVAMAVEWRQSA